jgi:hypothetical protein
MQVVADVPRDRHSSRLLRMPKLPMTSGLARYAPAVHFDELDDRTYLDQIEITVGLGRFSRPLRESPP